MGTKSHFLILEYTRMGEDNKGKMEFKGQYLTFFLWKVKLKKIRELLSIKKIAFKEWRDWNLEKYDNRKQ